MSLDPPLHSSYNSQGCRPDPSGVSLRSAPRRCLHGSPILPTLEINMADFLVRGPLSKLDPDVYELTQLEAERQARKLILIPSESTAPLAVREAMASAFQNIYAEGYPDEDTRWMSEEEILDYPERLT